MRRQFMVRVTSVPRNVTCPLSGIAKPEIALKNVVFPAPLGPIKAWIVPSRTCIETSSTARNPPNVLVTWLASSKIVSDTVGLGVVLRLAAIQGRFDRAEDSARKTEHARDEKPAQKDGPQRRDRRDDVFADHVDERTDQRAPDRAAAADDHHEHEVARLVPVELERIDDVELQPEQGAADARHRRGDQQRDEDEAVAVQPQVPYPDLVLAYRDERSPERRLHDRAKDDDRNDEDDQRDVVEGEFFDDDVADADGRPRQGHPVLAARHVGEAVRDEVEDLSERDREQPEVDAPPAQQERSQNHRAEEPGGRSDQHGNDEVDVEVHHRQSGAVGTQTEVRRVTEGGQTGVAEQQVHAHRRDRDQQNLAEGRKVDVDQRRDPRRDHEDDEHHGRADQLAALHPKMPSSPNSPRGRMSSTSARRMYIETSLAAGMNSVVSEIAIPMSKPPTMLPKRLPIPPITTVTQ